MSSSTAFEACLFEEDRQAALLFPIKKIRKVIHAGKGIVYTEGKDYVYEPGTNVITLPEGSAIPIFPLTEKYPPAGSLCFPDPGAKALTDGPDGKLVRYDGDMYFAGIQVEVDYEPVKEDWPEDMFETSKLFKGFPDKPVLTLGIIGDSIACGYNSTGVLLHKPYRKSWIQQLADAVAVSEKKPVLLENLSIAGDCSPSLHQVLDMMIERKPDLFMIHFGMNDMNAVPVEKYVESLKWAIDTMREKLPETQVMLISGMSGNAEWGPTSAEKYPPYVKATEELAKRENVIFANVNKVWNFAAERKGFLSMTGNGVNHPNDWGATLYTKVLLKVLNVPAL